MNEEKIRWVTTSKGKRGHRQCWIDYNAAIECGQESGDCGDPRCCFSEKYEPLPKGEAQAG